jgi:hypothetical protein
LTLIRPRILRFGTEVSAEITQERNGCLVFPWPQWRQLGELGILGIGSTGGGGARDLVVAMEALGEVLFPGPLVDTVFVLQVFEGDTAASIAEGKGLVSVSTGHYFPWGKDATWLASTDGDNLMVHKVTVFGPTVVSLAREPWVPPDKAEEQECLIIPPQAWVWAQLALASYLLGAATYCLGVSAVHARNRKQFGRTLGEFQAVSHALARCDAAVGVAQSFVRQCAWEWDDRQGEHDRSSIACAMAVKASVETALTCHQVLGAMGFSEETGLWRPSTRIRQWSLSAPIRRDVGTAVDEGMRLALEGTRWRRSDNERE